MKTKRILKRKTKTKKQKGGFLNAITEFITWVASVISRMMSFNQKQTDSLAETALSNKVVVSSAKIGDVNSVVNSVDEIAFYIQNKSDIDDILNNKQTKTAKLLPFTKLPLAYKALIYNSNNKNFMKPYDFNLSYDVNEMKMLINLFKSGTLTINEFDKKLALLILFKDLNMKNVTESFWKNDLRFKNDKT